MPRKFRLGPFRIMILVAIVPPLLYRCSFTSPRKRREAESNTRRPREGGDPYAPCGRSGRCWPLSQATRRTITIGGYGSPPSRGRQVVFAVLERFDLSSSCPT